MIFNEINSLFIHIPKCAGSTVSTRIGFSLHGENWNKISKKKNNFNGQWAQHWSYNEISKKIDSEKLGSMFKFCFVRNPWDRAVSEFLYVKSAGCSCSKAKVSGLTFSEFVERKFLCSFGRHRWPQKHFIVDSEGKVAVDKIFKVENFEEDFLFLVDKFKLKDGNVLKKSFNQTRNASQRIKKPYWEYYDSKTKLLIDLMFVDDINFFKYTYGDEAQ